MNWHRLDFLSDHPSPTKTRVLLVIGLPITAFLFVYINILFNQTEYPADIVLGSLTFSGPTLEYHFGKLIERGTLDLFRKIQYLDFVLIVSYGGSLFLSAVSLARRYAIGSSYRLAGFFGAFFFIAMASMDLIENKLLLHLLSEPLEVSNQLAKAYSSSAALKWGLFLLGMLWPLAILFYGRLKKRKAN